MTYQVFCLPSEIVLWVYTVFVAFRFRVPPSYSETYYLLRNIRPWMGRLFTLFCWVLCIGAGASMFELSEGRWFQFLGLFAMCGLGLVGTAAVFKSDVSQRRAHYIGAAVCAVAASLWIIFSGYWWVLAAWLLVAAIATMITGRGKWLFWGELALFYSTYMTFELMF